MVVLSLPPHERLGRALARHLRARVGRMERRTFSDGERYVRPVTTVRGQGVIVIANTGPDTDQLLDLLILLHALRSSGARRLTLVIPYLAYARQDRPTKPQEPVTIRLLARLVEAAGATSVVLVDPHSPIAARSFRIPAHIVDPLPTLAAALLPLLQRGSERGWQAKRVRGVRGGGVAIVAPDAGARHRAQRLARLLHARDVIVLRKERPRPNTARVAALTAHDQQRIRGRTAILVDDMIDTAGTITAAGKRLRAAGATRIAILATHAVLSGPAPARLRHARIDQIIVSDSLPSPRRSFGRRRALRTISLAPTLTAALRATYRRER